jgi:hypothetical protein
VNRRPVPVMVAIAALFAADLPAANSAGRVFNATMLLWCMGFIGWFWTHPRSGADQRQAARSVDRPAGDTATEAGRVASQPISLRPDATDPVQKARRRFRVRDDEPAPDPSHQSRG